MQKPQKMKQFYSFAAFLSENVQGFLLKNPQTCVKLNKKAGTVRKSAAVRNLTKEVC